MINSQCLSRDLSSHLVRNPCALAGIEGMAYPSREETLAIMRGGVLDLGIIGLPLIRPRVIWRDLVKSVARKVRKLANFLFSMGNAYETALLTLEFNNTNLATVGDATGLRGSSTAGSFYIGLHTADPGEAGDATTSEATFTGYARIAVARSSGGWTVSGNSVTNAAAITFAQNTGSDQTVGFFSISAGTDGAGSEVITRYGPLIASGATWLPFTAKTDDTITIPSNPFSVDDRIVLAAAYDGTLPTGTTQGTIYWVKTSSGNDITISTTQGGSAVDVTAVGSGVCIKAKPLAVRGGIDAVQFAASTLVCKID